MAGTVVAVAAVAAVAVAVAAATAVAVPVVGSEWQIVVVGAILVLSWVALVAAPAGAGAGITTRER